MVRDLVHRIDSSGKNRGLPLLLVGAGTVALILSVAWWATRPEWVVLAQGGDPDEIGEIAERLDDEGIPYRLEGRGTGLAVQEGQMARARVALARSGLPSRGRPGFEIFDQPTWGMTDFTQRIHYRRALEGELERTISGMRGVESAQVHLGIQESAVLRRTGGRNAEASVVVRLQGGHVPDRTFVAGIASLVAGSVDGLDPDRVRIIDDSGRLLSESDDESGWNGAADRHLRVRLEVERHLERKAEELLVAAVGEGNLSIRVSAELDFDRLERTVRAVDPEQQVTVEETRAEIIPGEPEQGAAQINTTQVNEPTRSVESFARSGARIERLNVAVLVGHHILRGDNGRTVQEPRSPEELQWIEALVTQAVGLSPDRGDGITVTNLPFVGVILPEPEPIPALGPMEWIERLQRPIIALLAILFATILGFAILRAVVREAKVAANAIAAVGGAAPALASGTPTPPKGGRPAASSEAAPAAPRPMEAPIPVAAAAPMMPAPEVSVDNPELTARLVRSWMREG